MTGIAVVRLAFVQHGPAFRFSLPLALSPILPAGLPGKHLTCTRRDPNSADLKREHTAGNQGTNPGDKAPLNHPGTYPCLAHGETRLVCPAEVLARLVSFAALGTLLLPAPQWGQRDVGVVLLWVY